MITGVVLDICNMSVTQMCMVEGEDNPELIEKIENTIQNYFWSGADMIEVRKYLTQLSCSRYHKYGYKIKCTEFMGIYA